MKDCILIHLCEHRSLYCDYRGGNRIGESGARISGNFSFCLALFLNYNGIDNFKELCVCFNF